MKPASFEYYAPTTLEEALDRIGEVGNDGGKILAGGQSLIPAMNFRLAQPTALVDLNRVEELFYIKTDATGAVLVGAMTRDTSVEFDPEVKKVAPMLHECLPFLAHSQIRNRGTFGGAVCHGDPAGQVPVVAVAQNYDLLIKSKANSERWVKAEDFYLSLYTNVVEPDEILVQVKIPKLPAHAGSSYKQTARQAGASAIVGVASVVELDEKEQCKNVRLVYMGVGEMPVFSQKAAEVMVGQKVNDTLIAEAVEACIAEELDPGQDMHATPAFRKHLSRELGKASIQEAFARAKK